MSEWILILLAVDLVWRWWESHLLSMLLKLLVLGAFLLLFLICDHLGSASGSGTRISHVR